MEGCIMEPQGTYVPMEKALFDRRTEVLRAGQRRRAEEYHAERAAAVAAGIRCFWCKDDYVCPVCNRGVSVIAHHRKLALDSRWTSPKQSYSHFHRY